MSEPEEFIEALRSVIRTSRIADLHEVALGEATAALNELAAQLETAVVPGERTQAALLTSWSGGSADAVQSFRDRIQQLGIESGFPYSPYVGALNAIAPPISLEIVPVGDRFELHGSHVFDAIYNGPPGGVHGGVIAGAMDELLGSLCVVNEVAGFTGTLTVRYEALTPIAAPITLRAWVDRLEGRKTIACGTFHHGETLCARAEGIFINTSSFAFG